MMAGVPPSSLNSSLVKYLWSFFVTKKTVPPPAPNNNYISRYNVLKNVMNKGSLYHVVQHF
jgi:hypothetical protein